MGYIVDNYLRRGLAEQRWSLLAAAGGCPYKTAGEKNSSILLAKLLFSLLAFNLGL